MVKESFDNTFLKLSYVRSNGNNVTTLKDVFIKYFKMVAFLADKSVAKKCHILFWAHWGNSVIIGPFP